MVELSDPIEFGKYYCCPNCHKLLIAEWMSEALLMRDNKFMFYWSCNYCEGLIFQYADNTLQNN